MGSFRDLTTARAATVFLPIGLLVACWSGYRWWTERQTLADAVRVEAEILSSRVEDWTSGSGTGRERHYRPVVSFRFELDGATHESNRVTPLGDSGSAGWARELVARFAPGSRVEAWAEPTDPQSAFLIRQTSWKPPVGVAVGLLLALAAAGRLLWLRRHPTS